MSSNTTFSTDVSDKGFNRTREDSLSEVTETGGESDVDCLDEKNSSGYWEIQRFRLYFKSLE